MDTRKVLKLTKAITAKTGNSSCIEQVLWSHDDGTCRSFYKFVWFTSPVDCDLQTFKTFQGLSDFIKEKWDVC